MRHLAWIVGLLAWGALRADAGTVAGTVTLDGQPVADAVVFLDSGGAPVPQRTPEPIVMDQRNLQFVPKVLPVLAGTTVEFTNSDDIQHNVFSPSAIAGKFDLGAYGPGAKRGVTLSEPGEVVILCNIHMEMEARIVVLRTPDFTVTAADGTYRIPGVAPGTYSVKVWHGRFLPDTRTITVAGDGNAAVDLTIGQ